MTYNIIKLEIMHQRAEINVIDLNPTCMYFTFKSVNPLLLLDWMGPCGLHKAGCMVGLMVLAGCTGASPNLNFLNLQLNRRDGSHHMQRYVARLPRTYSRVGYVIQPCTHML